MYMTSGITAFERLMYGYFLREGLMPFSGLVVAESSYVGVTGTEQILIQENAKQTFSRLQSVL